MQKTILIEFDKASEHELENLSGVEIFEESLA